MNVTSGAVGLLPFLTEGLRRVDVGGLALADARARASVFFRAEACARLGALIHRSHERAEANGGRDQVTDLVNLQRGVDLALTFEDLLHLVGGDGVEATAEGDEVHELQLRSAGHGAGGLI